MTKARALLLALACVLSCADEPAPAREDAALLLPGELCESDNRAERRLRLDPPIVVVAPGRVRPVRLVIEPDACDPTEATFVSDAPHVAAAPAPARFDLRHPTHDFRITGGAMGKATITVSMPGKDAQGNDGIATATLQVEVRDPTPPSCAAEDRAAGTVDGNAPTLRGAGALAKSSLAVRPEAFARTDEFAMPPFPAEIACAEDLASKVSPSLERLGPAVSFVASAAVSMSKPLRRELDFRIPINPAAFPPAARLRHLHVLYQGPRTHVPRAIPIASPRIVADGDEWVLAFSSPWLGTYQAAVERGAGEKRRLRRVTHRAVMGFSMGGGGAAVFGIRHHRLFDAIAPLGGPSDWTWMLHYIDEYALGGFCPKGKTCTPVPPNRYPMDEPYGHTQDFEHWFYERGNGNGGSFPRAEVVQIFEDLALSMGNPNGWNTNPGMIHMAPGPRAGDPWTTAPDGADCTFGVEPIDDDPNQSQQREHERRCRAHRCDPANAWIAPSGYYDDEYNPDGTEQVISFCDGGQAGESPYENGWAPGGNKPVNIMLAVDLNRNGIRDAGEPIIRSSHEPFLDCGTDGLCDPDEPGYDPVLNPDPNQDDYDYHLNPTGLEGNHRYDPGEKFEDVGLDGVPNTAALHVAGDPGEGDGIYTESPGLAAFYANDPHSMIARRVTSMPSGELTDDALRRIDILSDGGIRDLFNFSVVASHLTGQIYARKGESGLPLRSVAFYNGFERLPGQDPESNDLSPFDLLWGDLADMPSIRYGDLDASRARIEQGDGQHVGSGIQILNRLMFAFFFVGHRWPDADRRVSVDARVDPAPGAKECEVIGRCQHWFEGPRTHRVGPISVSLPPGYAHRANAERDVRYPVLYVLHGYGQDPRDLEALAIFTNNFMNAAERSAATRMPKFIVVYVDGRCRAPNGKPECIRGTFYMDSQRPGGPPMDAWFEEVVEFVDATYRTLGPVDIEVAD